MLDLKERESAHPLSDRFVMVFRHGVFSFTSWWVDKLRAYPAGPNSPEDQEVFWSSLRTAIIPEASLPLDSHEVQQLSAVSPFSGVSMNLLLGAIAMRFNVWPHTPTKLHTTLL